MIETFCLGMSTVLFGRKSGPANEDLEAKHALNKHLVIRGSLVVGALALVALGVASVILLRQAEVASTARKHSLHNMQLRVLWQIVVPTTTTY